MLLRNLGRFGSRLALFIVVSIFAGVLVAALFIPAAGMMAQAAQTVSSGMDTVPAELETPPQSEKSTVYLSTGEVLAEFYDENRTYKPLSEIAPVMRQAQIAIEDHRYYEHGAIDTRATMRALVRNTSSTGGTQGGSSITQQYVKMVQVETAAQNGDKQGVAKAQEQSMSRKIQELRYAVALEKRLSKDDILERYLNIAYYGDGSYGVESAAHHYFNTTAKDLTLDQAALLAGMVQNPVATDPVNYPRVSLERRNVVLNRMAELNVVSAEDAATARQVGFDKSKVQPNRNGCVSTRYPFLCDYVKRELENTPGLGATKAERRNTLNRGGLQIHTQIDPRTQDAAQAAIDKVFDPKDPVISTTTMVQPGTGLILAMAQSRPVMGNDQAAGNTYYNYAAPGPGNEVDMGGAEGYQAGSTFKAFTMAAALEKGIPISKTYDAAERMQFGGTTFTSCSGPFKSGPWEPANSTGHNGVMDMRTAAMWSVNTYFVQLERETGICETTRMAQRLGVELQDVNGVSPDNFPSFTLGASEVAPMQMAEAYATFASGGIHCNPVILQQVTKKDGTEIPVSNADCKRVMDERVANGMNSILQSVIEQGTGTRARVSGGYPQAGKTGTIDDNQAVWFAGYTPEVAAVSMIAIDKTHPYWKSEQWRRSTPSLKGIRLPASNTYLEGSGGGDAGQDLWRPAMTEALKGKPRTGFGRVDPKVQGQGQNPPAASPSSSRSPG
ncbi:transglycosylase domain-containing protein [Granulicoccus phenolivorans]|uniref:transglycosylase domain-containing protein n=1 Tax=Granulicoccus phenolivorans TaxID=266854 RepID=UPI0004160C76|nr:transglycosylase domain-containing protein [Granulicoccus phenolivorans]